MAMKMLALSVNGPIDEFGMRLAKARLTNETRPLPIDIRPDRKFPVEFVREEVGPPYQSHTEAFQCTHHLETRVLH